MVVTFRRHTLLPLDDCLYALQATISHLTRSSLHRCLQRHGISRLPEVDGDKSARKKFKAYPIGYFHVDLAEVRTEQGGACQGSCDAQHGTVRISVCGRAVEHYAAMALMKRSPKMTANCALAMVHSRGGIFHSFSERFKIR